MNKTLCCRALGALLALALVREVPVAGFELETIGDNLFGGRSLDAGPQLYEGQPLKEGPPLYEGKLEGPSSYWTGRLGWVQLWREPTSDVPLVEPDIGIGPRFTSSEFDFDSRSGFDGAISWDNGCGWGLDFRYLWVDDFTADGAFIPLDDPQIATTPPTDSLFDIGDLFSLDYTSEFQTFEVLGRRCFGKWNVSAGFRYIELNETLGIDIFDNPGNIFFEEIGFAAANDLYGFQLGLNGPLYDKGGKFRVDGFTKFGIYYNDVSAGAFLNDPLDPLVSGSGQGTASYTALGMEFGIYANYDITCNLSVRSGYQLMYLDGVALAADQVPNTGELFALPGTVPVNAHGGNSVLYHGLNVGLEYRY